MSPFAVGTWSVVGNTGIGQGGGKSPRNVAYSATQEVLCVGGNGSGPIFDFNPGQIARSLDGGETWATVYDSATDPTAPGVVKAPLALGLLRDPVTGAERFVACMAETTFFFQSSDGVAFTIYTSNTGGVWTRGQTLVSIPDQGNGTGVDRLCSSFAIRQPGGIGTVPEYYIYVRVNHDPLVERGVFRSTDLGLTWTNVNATVDLSGDLIAVAGRALVIASGARSEDGGQTWQAWQSADAFIANAMAGRSGTIVASRQATLTVGLLTRISCDEGRTMPVGQNGPSYGLGAGSATGAPVLLPIGSAWEILMAAAGDPIGAIEIVYSDTFGETEAERALFDSGSGIIFFLSGGAVIADGRPLFISGATGEVVRSSDVSVGAFGSRIYCVLAPAPGVGFPGFPDPCGDFYNPCAQECPAPPVQPAGVVVDIPEPVILGDVFAYGAPDLIYGTDAAIFGGGPNQIFTFPVLGKPEGCGATFVNEPCAPAGCPA